MIPNTHPQESNKCPVVDPSLVDHLSKQYPDSLSSIPIGIPEREFWIRKGKAEVVAYLQRMVEAQTKRGVHQTTP